MHGGISNSSSFIDFILKGLFAAEERRKEKTVVALIDANNEAYGERFDGFHYEGQFYRYPGLRGQLKRRVLHETLHARMDQFLADQEAIANDKQQIQQMLFKLISPCMTEQEMRDTLPNCLTSFLPDNIKKLERRLSEAFTITGDSRATTQYQKILPKIELYSSSHFLY